jgi:ABC-type glycerol-3-phosphate transport system substrate-binding protein
MQKQVNAWAEKNKADVTVDFITSSGNKILITAAAESQAGSGHDFMQMYNWDIGNFAAALEPADDVVKELSAKYGSYGAISEYLAKSNGHWWVVPSSTGTLNLTTCGRISMLKKYAGVDVLKMYPAHEADPKLSANWNYDAFLQAAEADRRLDEQHGHYLRGIRRGPGERQRRDHRRFTAGPHNAGILPEAGEILPAGLRQL